MKQVPQISATEAASMVKDGDIILGGGFGMTGNPVHLLHALTATKTKGLTFIGNNVGEPNLGGGKLLLNGQIKKMIGSFLQVILMRLKQRKTEPWNTSFCHRAL